MNLKKLYKHWPLLLFSGFFLWMVVRTFSDDLYYFGGPLKRLNVVIKKEPYHYYESDNMESYFYFTTQNYKAEFRISKGAIHLVSKNKLLKRRIKSLNPGDSIAIDIKPQDYKRLNRRFGGIRVLGLYYNNENLIDPVEVIKADKEDNSNRLFKCCNTHLINDFALVGLQKTTKTEKFIC